MIFLEAAEMEKTTPGFDSGLLFGKNEETHCLVRLSGNAEGIIQNVGVETGYVSGLNRFTLNISLWPEGSEWGIEHGAAWGDQFVTFQTEETVTGSGQAVF